MNTAQAMESREQKGNKDFTGIQRDCTKFAESSGMLFLIIQNQAGKIKVRRSDDLQFLKVQYLVFVW